MLDGPDLLKRVDQILAAVLELRAALRVAGAEAETFPRDGGNFPDDADDLADGNLLDSHSASARFGYPTDTIRLWARRGDGRKVGGRWLVSIPRLQRRLNGG